MKSKSIKTQVMHAGAEKEHFKALVPPIYTSATYIFDSAEQGGASFRGEDPSYIYTRLGNPTLTLLEKRVAEIEGAEAALAFSSGMGAISSVFYTLVENGDHIIADETLYGCTFALLNHGLKRLGIEVTFIDINDLEAYKKAFRPNTKVVYFETPANPTLKVIDIEETSKIAHNYNADIAVVCDNTFATPYLQLPLKLGVDIVVHSATKYLNGHGDVIAGMVAGRKEFMDTCRFFGLKDMTGAVLGPMEAYLILRGLKTLAVRMKRHCDNAIEVAKYLEKHPKVKKVFYPGLESDEGYLVAKKQMHNGFGGMIAMILEGDFNAGMKFINSLKMIQIAVSLGDCETLAQHPASMTHSTYTEEELAQAKIDESLVRLSIGIEDVEDIISDLDQALEKL